MGPPIVRPAAGPSKRVIFAKGTRGECTHSSTNQEPRVVGPSKPTLSSSIQRDNNAPYNRSQAFVDDPSKARRIEALVKYERFLKQPCPGSYERPWQKRLDIILSKPPDQRTIYWVYGPQGNDGKTHYAKKLWHHGWYYTKGGKKDNVIYQYMNDIDRHVVVDIPRESKDYIQYDLLEMIKDRTLISNKYEPISIPDWNNAHVIVMANFLPDYEKISKDRITLIEC